MKRIPVIIIIIILETYIAPYARASKRFTILPLVIGIAHHPHIRGYAADRDQRDLTSHTSQVPN